MYDGKIFSVNDHQLAVYMMNHGSKLICIENGIYIFEYDDFIDENIELFETMQEKCMF